MRTPNLDKQAQENELILAPGYYAYMQEANGGTVKINVGPCVINRSAQEFPVIYEHKRGFRRVSSLQEAVRQSPIAVQGFYLQLYNPTEDFDQQTPEKAQPNQGVDGKTSPKLRVGRKVNIAGPTSFALWPGQHVEAIRGHHLRSNQYLFVRVYDEAEARKHWTHGVMHRQVATVTPTTTEEQQPEQPQEGAEAAPQAPTTPEIVADATIPDDLSVGKILLVRGTEVSFFIPPTGVAVMRDENGEFVREALSLERLEYCILVDENGKKRYEKGPQVVFPAPTERFIIDTSREEPRRKFRALELNDIQGIYIKVIADYSDHKAGDELFITGATQKIYYPREEHALVKYDNNAKHFATAIPKGEARYVLDRMNGDIAKSMGPDMVLLDPRHKVFVRRALTDDQCKLWYPGNQEVLQYNAELRELQNSTAGTRGAITDGEYSRSSVGKQQRAKNPKGHRQQLDDLVIGDRALLGERGDQGIVGDEISRRATYTEPRTVQLGGKFDRVPVIKPFIGYAVKVVSNTGSSRVVQHPDAALLDYDETLEILTLSTGEVKSTANVKKVAYLRVKNNKVSDTVSIETQDHVGLQIRLSYLVNFYGDPEKWFSVENYIQHMTDHVRSVLKGAARRIKVADLYNSIHVFVRDTILGIAEEGAKRPGMKFDVNGMVIEDVDVLHVRFNETRFENLLKQSQEKVVAGNIQIADAQHENDVVTALNIVARERALVEEATSKQKHELALAAIARNLVEKLTTIENQRKEVEEQIEIEGTRQKVQDVSFDAGLAREQRKIAQLNERAKFDHQIALERIRAETEAMVSKFEKAMPGFSAALTQMHEADTAVKVANAMSVQTMVGGHNLVETVTGMFGNTKLGALLSKAVQQVDETRPNG